LLLSLGMEYRQDKQLENIARQKNDAMEETTPPQATEAVMLPELEALYLQNKDLAGWLSLPAVGVDYPVVYDPPETPEYYLHRAFDGSYSFAGIPFIGIGADTESDCIIIYGHNMADGSMFGSLDSYREEKTFTENPTLSFSTLYERREYKIFASKYCRILSEEEEGFRYHKSAGVLTEEEYGQLVEFLLDNTRQKSGDIPEYGQQIIILSTCDSSSYDSRFIVAAYAP